MNWSGQEIDAAIIGYTPLVRSIAWNVSRSLPASVEFDDLVQAGMMGLLEAATRFDPGQGAPFHGFAADRIRGAMLDDLREADWLPRSVRKAKRDMAVATDKMQHREGRAARHSEIAAELGLSLDDYHLIAADASSMASLEDLDVAAEGDLADDLETKRQRIAYLKGLARLPPRHRQIMAMIFDLDLPLATIAATFGVTDTRICQIKREAIVKLRKYMWIYL